MPPRCWYTVCAVFVYSTHSTGNTVGRRIPRWMRRLLGYRPRHGALLVAPERQLPVPRWLSRTARLISALTRRCSFRTGLWADGLIGSVVRLPHTVV